MMGGTIVSVYAEPSPDTLQHLLSFSTYDSRLKINLYYLLTPWITVLLEKLTGSQLVNKFPTFYWTRRFITAFTSARHLSLSWASSIQSTPPHPTSWRSNLILSSHLRLGLPSGSFPQVSPPKPCIRLSCPHYVLHAPLISFFSICSPEQYWERTNQTIVYAKSEKRKNLSISFVHKLKLTCTGIYTQQMRKISSYMFRHSMGADIREPSQWLKNCFRNGPLYAAQCTLARILKHKRNHP